jgi:hypothetical protein
VAPGYWECRSLVAEHRPGRIPDPSGGAGAMRPVTAISYQPCATRYHEAAGGGSTLLCGCSTFAIGVCAQCATPVCGDCSRVLQGHRLCNEHARAREEATAAAITEAQLTPEKFLVLARAAGNPGLRSWTIVRKGIVQAQRQAGRFRTVTYEKEGVVDEYQIRGWMIPGVENLDWLLCLMITDDGAINSISQWRGVPRSLFADTPKDHAWELIFPIDEREISFDGWRSGEAHRGESSNRAMDVALRELCRILGITA